MQFFLCMSKVSKCKKTEGCSRTRWKGGLCRKCFAQEKVVAVTPAPTKKKKKTPALTKKKKKKKIIYEKGKGSAMIDEYNHVALSSATDEVAKILIDAKASALDIFASLVSPPRKPASRCLYRPQTQESSAAMRLVSTKIVEAMKKSKKFPELFRTFKAPACIDDCYVVAYPLSHNVACPTLHRDFLEKYVYSIFLLLSPITRDNGTVQLFLKSSSWERNEKRNTEDVIKHNEIKSGTSAESLMIMGEECDVIAFDARLLHQSMPNTSDNTRIVFSFTLYDSSRNSYPSLSV